MPKNIIVIWGGICRIVGTLSTQDQRRISAGSALNGIYRDPENFIKASDVLPIVVPEDGPAEFNFREMVYRVLDEKRYDMIKT